MPDITGSRLIQHLPSQLGMGDHSDPGSLKEVLAAEKRKDICVNISGSSMILSVILGGGGMLCITSESLAIAATPLLYAAGACGGVGTIFVLFCIYAVMAYRKETMRYAGVFNSKDLFKGLPKPQSSVTNGSVQAIAMRNTMTTHVMRKKMIAAANSSIVISGNYCGGISMDETLAAIKDRMKLCETVRTVILSSPKFLTKSNKAKIRELEKEFPNRFQLIITPDIWHLDPGLKKSTNHTKGTVIDGKYAIFGGSGIEDKYALNDGLHESPRKEVKKEGFDIIEALIARRFRDEDWAFKADAPSQLGGNLESELLFAHRQLLQLGIRNFALTEADRLGARFWKKKKGQVSCLAMDLLSESYNFSKVTEAAQHTKVPAFDNSLQKVKNVSLRMFSSGPEHQSSEFVRALVSDINRAEKEIMIAQLYFHPPKEIEEALIKAAKRGVKITVITNGWGANAPTGHKLFGPRNRYNAWYIASSLPREYQKNFKLYEFACSKTSLHKKAAIIDDKVYFGSGNWGYKSMITTSDWELNGVATSKELARKTREVFLEDMHYSNLVEQPTSISVITKLRAGMHRVWAPLVG